MLTDHHFSKPVRNTIIGVLLLSAFSITACRSIASVQSHQHRSSESTKFTNQDSGESTDQTTTSDRWPTRWGNNPNKRGIIIDLDPTITLVPRHYSRHHQPRTTPIDTEDITKLAQSIGRTEPFKFKPEYPGAFVFILKHIPGVSTSSDPKPDPNAPDLAFKFVSATRAIDKQVSPELPQRPFDPTYPYKLNIVPLDKNTEPPKLEQSNQPTHDENHVILQRTWFSYSDPKLQPDQSRSDPSDSETTQADPSQHAKGTIVLLPGMFGTPELIVEACIRYWKTQGYAILLMRSQPSRFSEHELIESQPGMASLQGTRLAKMNDERVAEGAYATSAAIEHLHTKRPSLTHKPTILVGMSGGAMMLPTVHAYNPDLYDAAILIAGGADFVKIAIRSNYKSWIDAIVFDFDPNPQTLGTISDDSLEVLSQKYLNYSKLDAFHTAREMNTLPVLMLHASTDKAVPSSSGELLYQQLGRPERWSYPFGHELIFIGLPTQITRMTNWFESKLDIE